MNSDDTSPWRSVAVLPATLQSSTLPQILSTLNGAKSDVPPLTEDVNAAKLRMAELTRMYAEMKAQVDFLKTIKASGIMPPTSSCTNNDTTMDGPTEFQSLFETTKLPGEDCNSVEWKLCETVFSATRDLLAVQRQLQHRVARLQDKASNYERRLKSLEPPVTEIEIQTDDSAFQNDGIPQHIVDTRERLKIIQELLQVLCSLHVEVISTTRLELHIGNETSVSVELTPDGRVLRMSKRQPQQDDTSPTPPAWAKVDDKVLLWLVISVLKCGVPK